MEAPGITVEDRRELQNRLEELQREQHSEKAKQGWNTIQTNVLGENFETIKRYVRIV